MDFAPIALLFAAVIVFVFYTVLGGVFFPRQAISLNWPERMDQNAFVRRVFLHLKHLGWTVEKSSTPEYTLGIRRDNRRFYVVCVPSDHAVTSRALDDFCNVVKKSRWAQALFCVTADRVDQAATRAAMLHKVFVINYRDMGAMEELFESHLRNTPRQPT
jgi:hypothetical protein